MNLKYIDSEWDLDTQSINQFLRDLVKQQQESVENEEQLLEMLEGFEIRQIKNRFFIHLDDTYVLGFDTAYFPEHRILHLNTPKLSEIADLNVGDQRKKVDELFPSTHWNTAFGKEADLIGFIGEMLPYSYIDRYGYERESEVPEIQVEIENNEITYLFISSERFPTSKGIKVGDSLSDVYRTYGNQFVRERVDGKQIVVYDVDFGSIWFIADEKIERIAYWNHHIKGFGDQKKELENDQVIE